MPENSSYCWSDFRGGLHSIQAVPKNSNNNSRELSPAYQVNGTGSFLKATKSQYDFTNMSPKELANLHFSGEIDIGFIPLILPPNVMNVTNEEFEATQNKKMNFLDFYNDRITYEKSLPFSEERKLNMAVLEKALNTILDFQGKQKNSISIYT